MNRNPTSLFNILNGMRNFGVGARVTRNIYKKPDTYWIITKCSLSKDQQHGKVSGILVWNGVAKVKSAKIGPANKRQWSLVGTPDYKTFDGTTEAAYALAPARADGLTFANTRRTKPEAAAEAAAEATA